MELPFVKFRARKYGKKTWLKGPAKHTMFGGYYIWLDESYDWVLVDKTTLTPYMNFNDIKNKDVYAGDIVKDRAGRIMKIVYHNFRYQFEAITETNFKYADFYEWQIKSYQKEYNKRISETSQLFQIEIIGNVFDNPELLII